MKGVLGTLALVLVATDAQASITCNVNTSHELAADPAAADWHPLGTNYSVDLNCSSSISGAGILYAIEIKVEHPDGGLVDSVGVAASNVSFTPSAPGVVKFKYLASETNCGSACTESTGTGYTKLYGARIDGPLEEVPVGKPVTLKGFLSFGAGYPSGLKYQWNVVSSPEGSEATFSAPTSGETEITPDRAGQYTISLRIEDVLDQVHVREGVGTAFGGDLVASSPSVAQAIFNFDENRDQRIDLVRGKEAVFFTNIIVDQASENLLTKPVVANLLIEKSGEILQTINGVLRVNEDTEKTDFTFSDITSAKEVRFYWSDLQLPPGDYEARMLFSGIPSEVNTENNFTLVKIHLHDLSPLTVKYYPVYWGDESPAGYSDPTPGSVSEWKGEAENFAKKVLPVGELNFSASDSIFPHVGNKDTTVVNDQGDTVGLLEDLKDLCIYAEKETGAHAITSRGFSVGVGIVSAGAKSYFKYHNLLGTAGSSIGCGAIIHTDSWIGLAHELGHFLEASDDLYLPVELTDENGNTREGLTYDPPSLISGFDSIKGKPVIADTGLASCKDNFGRHMVTMDYMSFDISRNTQCYWTTKESYTGAFRFLNSTFQRFQRYLYLAWRNSDDSNDLSAYSSFHGVPTRSDPTGTFRLLMRDERGNELAAVNSSFRVDRLQYISGNTRPIKQSTGSVALGAVKLPFHANTHIVEIQKDGATLLKVSPQAEILFTAIRELPPEVSGSARESLMANASRFRNLVLAGNYREAKNVLMREISPILENEIPDFIPSSPKQVSRQELLEELSFSVESMDELASRAPPLLKPILALTLDKASYSEEDPLIATATLQVEPIGGSQKILVEFFLNGEQLPATQLSDRVWTARVGKLAKGEQVISANSFLVDADQYESLRRLLITLNERNFEIDLELRKPLSDLVRKALIAEQTSNFTKIRHANESVQKMKHMIGAEAFQSFAVQ